jgi:hypothetical protein
MDAKQDDNTYKQKESPHVAAVRWILLFALALPSLAQASLLSGDALDTAANVVSWIVILVVPIGLIVLFWLVHILPEKVAEKRQHPQKDGIKTLCMLSLFFGGLLWPLAWLWAYSRPVGYKMAFGTDKHHDYFLELVVRAREGRAAAADIEHALQELSDMEASHKLPADLRNILPELKVLHARALERKAAVDAAAAAATVSTLKGV